MMWRSPDPLTFVRRNIFFAIIAFLYVVIMAFLVAEAIEHADAFGFGVSKGEHVHPEEFEIFAIMAYIMGGLGFIMMTILFGNVINAGRAYRESEQAWQKLARQMSAIEASTDGIAILDADGNYNYMNAAHARVYGFDNANLLFGRNWRMFYSPAQILMIENKIFPLVQEKGEWSGTLTGLKHNGTEFPQEISLKILEDGGLICNVRDLTEKMHNERLMAIIMHAVEAASDGIAITDENNRMLFMNGSFLSIHGYDPGDAQKYLGQDWRDFYNMKGQDQINNSVLPTTHLKGLWSGSLPVMRKDGTMFYGDASLTKIQDGLVLGVMRDVTDRKIAEMEREALKEQLFVSQKAEAIFRMSSRIVSDFGTVISRITDWAEALSQKDGDAEQAQFTANILREARKGEDLVEQLLSFSHGRKTQAALSSLSDIVGESGRALLESPPDGVTVVLDIKLDSAMTALHAAQAQQIVTNLTANALDALHGAGGKIAITLRRMDRNLLGLRRHMMMETAPDRNTASAVRLREGQSKIFLMTGFLQRDQEYIELIISDTGLGIIEDILPNIFDPFFTTKPPKRGTGLGLSIVQGMVISCGGAIIIETVPAQGTSVHVFFPKSNVSAQGQHSIAA